jgi:hypothetical protein
LRRGFLLRVKYLLYSPTFCSSNQDLSLTHFKFYYTSQEANLDGKSTAYRMGKC